MKSEDKFIIPYDNLIESIIEEVYVCSKEGIILYANLAAMIQTGYEDITDRTITELFPKTLEVNENGITIINKEQILKQKVLSFCYRKNGTCYPVRLKIIKKGEIYGVIVRNLSELVSSQRQEKIIKEELDYANSRKNEFVANITHELRTPVNGIKGIAEVLSESELNSKQKESVHIIKRCCDNMNDMINQILDFTKLAAGKIEMTEAPFDLHRFIKQSAMLHETAVTKKGLKFSYNIASNVPKNVVGDELRLGQILNNLLSNAVKFTSVGQIVLEVVCTFESDEEIELFFMVTDTGIGIGKEEMDKLFLSFSQVDGSITRKFGGTGLGLAISKRLVEMMNGSIHVTSEKGEGSRFSFCVRLKQCQSGNDCMIDKEKHETLQSNSRLEPIQSVKQDKQSDKLNNSEEILNLSERLNISVDLGLWDKAEYYSTELKKLIPREYNELWRQAFRIELATRKEEPVEIRKQMNLMCDMLSQYMEE